MKTPQRIDRITHPGVDVFEREYVCRSRPVIVRDLIGCPAARWTPEYLCSVIGGKTVNVATSATGAFDYREGGPAYQTREMPFSRAVDLMRFDDSGEKYYVMQRSIHHEFPELTDDVSTPTLVDPCELDVVNLWVGSAGNVTPLHFDRSNNLLFQAYGHKIVRIYSPEHTPYLYPLPEWSQCAHVSSVDLEHPDLSRFPLIEEPKPFEAFLAAGDTLFLPAFWWHHVRSTALSISVNYWWKSHPRQFMAPNSLRSIPAMFARNRLSGLRVRGGLIALSEYACREAKIYWLAALCALGAFDQHVRQLLRKHNVDDQMIPGRFDSLYSSLLEVDRSIPSLKAERLNLWTCLAAEARAADDRRPPPGEVADIVSAVKHFIDSTALDVSA